MPSMAGRVDRVLVEAGDMVQEGQPMIELSNTNLALQVIQQESQLNQAISQLQQNEIALEENQLSNDRALAEIDYNLVRLNRSASVARAGCERAWSPLNSAMSSRTNLRYYKRLRPIQAESGPEAVRPSRAVAPDIHEQLKILRGNLDGGPRQARQPGHPCPSDRKGDRDRSQGGREPRSGQRLAEVTPQTGMKLIADIDEFYLARVRVGQTATVTFDGKSVNLTVRRVSPQVHNGQFRVDLDFDGASPPRLWSRARLPKANCSSVGIRRRLILPMGPSLSAREAIGSSSLTPDGRSAERRRIKVGRRTSEQLEVLSGLRAGERVVTSDYTGLDKIDRIVFTH